jgi:rhodanese-related sulfurtransferase
MTEIEIDPETVASRLDEFEIIDVRDPEDYDEGYIPGSENIPLDDVEDAVAAREWDGRVAVICYRGNSSIPAAKLIDAHTDADAVSVAGGHQTWDGPIADSASAD